MSRKSCDVKKCDGVENKSDQLPWFTGLGLILVSILFYSIGAYNAGNTVLLLIMIFIGVIMDIIGFILLLWKSNCKWSPPK